MTRKILNNPLWLSIACCSLGMGQQNSGGLTPSSNPGVVRSITNPTTLSCIVGSSAPLVYNNEGVDTIYTAQGSPCAYAAPPGGSTSTLTPSGVGASGPSGANKLVGPANNFIITDGSGNGQGGTPSAAAALLGNNITYSQLGGTNPAAAGAALGATALQPGGNGSGLTGLTYNQLSGNPTSAQIIAGLGYTAQNSAVSNTNNAGIGSCSSGLFGTGTASGGTQPCAQVNYSQLGGTNPAAAGAALGATSLQPSTSFSGTGTYTNGVYNNNNVLTQALGTGSLIIQVENFIDSLPVNVISYGAIKDAKLVTGISTTSGSFTVTIAGITSAAVNDPITFFKEKTNQNFQTKILSVSGTTATLRDALDVTDTGRQVYFGTDDTAFINIAAAYAITNHKSLYFPGGGYYYSPTFSDLPAINGWANPSVYGEGPQRSILYIGGLDYFVDDNVFWNTSDFHDMEYFGGSGPIRQRLLTQNVGELQSFHDNMAFEFAGCAYSWNSGDVSTVNIKNNYFQAVNSTFNGMGLCIYGSDANTVISDNSFVNQLVGIKLGLGGNGAHISHNEFFNFFPEPTPNTVLRSGIWLVPSTGLTAYNTLIKDNKFGPENLDQKDVRVLLADCTRCSSASPPDASHLFGDSLPLTSVSTGFISNTDFSGNTVATTSAGSFLNPVFYSYSPNVSANNFQYQIAGGATSYVLQFDPVVTCASGNNQMGPFVTGTTGFIGSNCTGYGLPMNVNGNAWYLQSGTSQITMGINGCAAGQSYISLFSSPNCPRSSLWTDGTSTRLTSPTGTHGFLDINDVPVFDWATNGTQALLTSHNTAGEVHTSPGGYYWFSAGAGSLFRFAPDGQSDVCDVTIAGLICKAGYSIAAPTITDSGLTPGNCVQAGTGGLLGTTSTPCPNSTVVPQNVTPIQLTGQTASIGATNILASAPVGGYRACGYLVVTTGGLANAGNASLVFGWNDGTAIQSNTPSGLGSIALLTTGDEGQGCTFLRSAASQNITYSTTLSSVTGAPTYSLYVTLERLF